MSAFGPRIDRATPREDGFNSKAVLPYSLRLEDFRLAMLDVYDLLHDINQALLTRGVKRFEETVRAAIFSGILSDTIAASVARHSRVLTENQFHNGHPDLIPEGVYAHDKVQSGHEGVEVKATKGRGAVDTHGARDAWLLVFRYRTDSETEPAIERAPSRFVEILLAQLSTEDFRRNDRGELGTRTASPNRAGMKKLRANWIYRDL
ncbi:MAG: hypothetical protein OXF41_03935 [bacterium]|nr:hypothetical protein [bacterium]